VCKIKFLSEIKILLCIAYKHFNVLIKDFVFYMKGCLNPVRVIIPKGSLLHPSDTAAVVGGNVLTSQRIVDVVLKAFEVCAASQGCMNNITFGEDKWGYYETVAGGAGAVSSGT
jgi:5-oxoprolinase (ATP-hydrolysing)